MPRWPGAGAGSGCSHGAGRRSSSPPIRSSRPRSATSSGCTWIRRTRPSSCALMRRPDPGPRPDPADPARSSGSSRTGHARHVSATQSYLGTTTRSPDMDQVDCTARDGVSVTAWGDLDTVVNGVRNEAGPLARTCTFYNQVTDEALESDAKINDQEYYWYITKPADCASMFAYSLEATMTHERGHTFGLKHVSEGEHGYLTMSKRSQGPCQNSEATLGLWLASEPLTGSGMRKSHTFTVFLGTLLDRGGRTPGGEDQWPNESDARRGSRRSWARDAAGPSTRPPMRLGSLTRRPGQSHPA